MSGSGQLCWLIRIRGRSKWLETQASLAKTYY